MGKSVKFGHIASYNKDATRTSASNGNIPRCRQKISKGFRSVSEEMSPLNIGVGGVFTTTYPDATLFRSAFWGLHNRGEMANISPIFEGDTYRVEEVSIQYQAGRDKHGKPTGPITEESVIYLRPISMVGSYFRMSDWENRPRSYTKKVGGEIVEQITLS